MMTTTFRHLLGSQSRAYGLTSALVGAAMWLGLVAWHRPLPRTESWTVVLLLLAPLVLVPLLLQVVGSIARQGDSGPFLQWGIKLQLPAAAALAVAFTQSPGVLSAVLALPWLLTTCVIALAGLMRAWQRGLTPLAELCLDVGLIYLAVGGGWTILDRFGVRPLDFHAAVVLLTAMHFHYAGYVLLVLTGLAGRACKGRIACLAAAGAIGGVPLVAIGITATQLGYGPLLECLVAWGMASAGLLSAGLHFQLAYRGAYPARARGLWAIAAIGLSVGMIYAVLYGSRAYLPLAWVTLPWMRAVHGSANALGFGLAATVAWLIAMRRVAAPDVESRGQV